MTVAGNFSGSLGDLVIGSGLKAIGVKDNSRNTFTPGTPSTINAIPVIYGRPGWVMASPVITGYRIKNWQDADEEVEYNRLCVIHICGEGIMRTPEAFKIEGKLAAFSKKYSLAKATLLVGEPPSSVYLNSYTSTWDPGWPTGSYVDRRLDTTRAQYNDAEWPFSFNSLAKFTAYHNTRLTADQYVNAVPQLEYLPNGIALHDPRIPFNYDNSFVYIIPKAGLGITDDAAIREMLPKSEIGGVSRGWYAENIWPEVHGQTPAYLAGNYLAYNYSFNSNSYSQLGDTPDNNPALVFLDYVVSDIYGAGIPIADLSMQSIIDSANYCDQLAPTTSISLSQNQMACNLSVNTENTLRKNIEDILQTCRGKVAWIDGQYHLDINKAGAPVAGVLDTQIIKRTAVSFGKRENRLNRIIGTYSEPNNGYNEMQVVYPPVGSAEDMQWRITEDKGVLNEKEIRLAGCTNAYQAVDLLATHIRESRNSIRAEYECNLEALMFTLGDIILVTDPTGLWTNKMCKIINWTLDFTRRIIKLRVAEHSDAAYDNLVKPILVREEGDIINTYQEFNKNLNVSLTSGDETLYVGPDGSIQAGLRVDWDENTAAIGFDIEYKLSSDESYTKIPIASSTARTAMIRPIISGEKYDVQIRARGRTRLAEWQQVNNFTALGKQLLPPDVVQFFVDGNNLSWVEPELKPLDLSGYVLRYHVGESRDWSTAQPMHSGVITQTQYQVPFALYDKMVLLIKSIDTSGNLSRNAAVIARGFGDVPVKNVVFNQNILNNFNHRLIESGEPQGDGSVLAAANGDFYDAVRSDVYDASNFWAPWGYSSLSVIYAVDLPVTVNSGEQVYISVGVTGDSQAIEVSWGNMGDTQPAEPWRTIPRVLSAPDIKRRLFVRIAVHSALAVRSSLNSLSVLVDVPDVTETINDVDVSGSYTILIAKKYRTITSISMTLQDTGGTAIGAEIISKNNLAPVIRCYDALRNTVDGKLDLIVQGY